MKPTISVTYYLEVSSSWCFWAETIWAELKQRYGGQVAFDWKIAKMRAEDFPVSHEQYDYFLRRSSQLMKSPFVINSEYFEPGQGYPWASFVAEAARAMGVSGDEVRLALSRAAYREHRKIGRIEEAVSIAGTAADLDLRELRARAESKEVAKRIEETTQEFNRLQVTQRPTFVFESPLGDRAVFSGIVRPAPLLATLDAMISELAFYRQFDEVHGPVPNA